MFSFNVGSIINFLDKEFTIKSRCWKEDINGMNISYTCIDEIGDVHVFSEEFMINEINRERVL